MEMQEKQKAFVARPNMGTKKLYESCYGLFLTALYANRMMHLADKLRVHKAFEERFRGLVESVRRTAISGNTAAVNGTSSESHGEEFESPCVAREFTLSG
jgi:hypothetical protein